MTWGRPEGAHSIGWLTSVCLHATLALGALLVTQRLTLAPQPAPFTWNVAMVAISSKPASAQTSAPPTTSIQTSLTKAPLPSAPGHASTAPNGRIPARAMTVESTAPPSEEPMLRRNQSFPVLDSSVPIETIEPQQAVDQVTAPTEAVVPTSQLSGREPQTPSDSSPTTPLQPQESSLPVQASSPAAFAASRPDYAWLSETIMRRMQELKRYPAEARLDRAEGKVVLKAVIRSNGSIEAIEVFQTSGHQILDRAAVELLTQAAPFHLPRPLEKPQMTVKIPMNYRLEP